MILPAVSLLLFTTLVSAALQNTTIDDQDFSRISYVTASNWDHYPLTGYETFFYNRSRSYTYVPGAYASFNFTGTGIYLQGPYADDQANRWVILDGKDVGQFGAYSDHRNPSVPFWGAKGLANGDHNVIVKHNDTTTKILVMDAWIVESELVEPTPTNSAGVAGAPGIASGTHRVTLNILLVLVMLVSTLMVLHGHC